MDNFRLVEPIIVEPGILSEEELTTTELEFYKPHIKIKLVTSNTSAEIKELYPPIEINSFPDTLEMNCTITHDCLANFAMTALLDVVNLSSQVKYNLLNKKYDIMIIYAGYLGREYFNTPVNKRQEYIDNHLRVLFKGQVLYMGTVVSARKNVTTRFLAVQNYSGTFSAFNSALSFNFKAGYNLYQLIADITRNTANPDYKLNISEEDYEEFINTELEVKAGNKENVSKVLDAYGITITAGFDISADSSSHLNSWTQLNSSMKTPTSSNTIEVNENTGLIDIPTLQVGDHPMLRFKMLFDHRVRLFNYVKLRNSDIQLPTADSGTLDSTTLESLNAGIFLDNSDEIGFGYYLVKKVTYSLNSRGTNFIMDIEAVPHDVFSKITTGE